MLVAVENLWVELHRYRNEVILRREILVKARFSHGGVLGGEAHEQLLRLLQAGDVEARRIRDVGLRDHGTAHERGARYLFPARALLHAAPGATPAEQLLALG